MVTEKEIRRWSDTEGRGTKGTGEQETETLRERPLRHKTHEGEIETQRKS